MEEGFAKTLNCPLNRKLKYIVYVSVEGYGTCAIVSENLSNERLNPDNWTNQHARALSVGACTGQLRLFPPASLPLLDSGSCNFCHRTAAALFPPHAQHAGSRESVAEAAGVDVTSTIKVSVVRDAVRWGTGWGGNRAACLRSCQQTFLPSSFPSWAVTTFLLSPHGTPDDGDVRMDVSPSSPWSRGVKQRVGSRRGGREHRCPRRRRTEQGNVVVGAPTGCGRCPRCWTRCCSCCCSDTARQRWVSPPPHASPAFAVRPV